MNIDKNRQTCDFGLFRAFRMEVDLEAHWASHECPGPILKWSRTTPKMFQDQLGALPERVWGTYRGRMRPRSDFSSLFCCVEAVCFIPVFGVFCTLWTNEVKSVCAWKRRWESTFFGGRFGPPKQPQDCPENHNRTPARLFT